VVPQSNCEPPCGPDESCCAGFVCCECCSDAGDTCGRFETVKSGGGVPVRVCVGEPAPGAPPWLDPTGCEDLRTTTIFYQGIGGRCTGSLVACGEGIEVHCPYHGNAIAFSEPGPLVCCERLRQGLGSREPCDPAMDADCDGRPNGSDEDPFAGAAQAAPEAAPLRP
jgi:hypothetical protein